MTKQNLTTADAIRAAMQGGQGVDAGAALRKAFATECKAIDQEARSVDFVISTASVDRMGDTISVDGWKLDTYRKNPVVLWAHDASMLPIAKASNVRVEDGKLKARAEFMPKDISGMSNAVFEMIRSGFLSATSVGFAPIKYAFSEAADRKFGIDFIEQELLEFSVVPIPANAEALIEARLAGIDIEPVREWATKLLETQNLATISRDRLKLIEGLATEFRSIAGKLPKHAAGASGIWRRAANTVERVLGGSVPAPKPEAPKPAGTPALDAARRRMAAIRARLT
jgi:HK97 family phage prohead protease